MINKADIKTIVLGNDEITLELQDGRKASEKFINYERLKNASQKQRTNYTISYFGIHWPEIDEDLSFDGFFNN